MKGRIARVIESSYLPVGIIFLIVVLLQVTGILSLPVKYDVLAYILPLLAIPGLLQPKRAESNRLPAANYILLTAFLLALGIRLIPLIHSPVPLGYDPGFYKYTMDLYYKALPNIPETGLASWVKQMFEQGLFVLSDVMHILAGMNAMDIINYLFPFLGALLVLPLFVVTRDLFNTRVGIIASLLYAVSYTQYTAFTMFYFRNVIGLMFLLLAIYALEREKDWLMALMFAALGVFHRPEFLLFALILIPYFIMHRRRGIILAVVGTAILIAPFWIPRWEIYRETVTSGIGGGGTFFGFDTYSAVSLAFLPFAAIGAIYMVINRKFNSILIYFVITCVIVVFQLIFFNRFIIMLDLSVVIMAAAGIEYSLLQKRGTRIATTGAIAVLLVLVATGVPTVTEASNISPNINEEQLQAVEWIKDNTEANAFVVTNSDDAPWVLGWSDRKVIAPGLFDWYVQSQQEWVTFLESSDPEVAKQFVDAYNGPVYIYSSESQGNDMNLEKFENGYFQKVYDKGAVVYKYVGGD